MTWHEFQDNIMEKQINAKKYIREKKVNIFYVEFTDLIFIFLTKMQKLYKTVLMVLNTLA
jgi:hypothetical protein